MARLWEGPGVRSLSSAEPSSIVRVLVPQSWAVAVARIAAARGVTPSVVLREWIEAGLLARRCDE